MQSRERPEGKMCDGSAHERVRVKRTTAEEGKR
jgi:hypothetical protein